MFNKYKPAIITLSIIALIAFGIVDYVKHLIDQPTEGFNKPQELSGNNTVIPKEFEFKGAKIALAWTDDNTGEDLIIQSDKKIYYGFNNIDVYFSITNISKKDQAVDIKFLSQKNNHINLINPCERIASNLADTSAPSAAPALGAVRAGQTHFYKATLKFPPMTKGEFLIEANGDKGGYGLLDPWYNSNWSYWKKITINSSQVATTTSNFPVLATSTDSDLRTVANGGHVGNDNGYDIVFADSDGETLLNFEKEKYASTTGEIVYWIKTDISSTTDKVIYMYYGNSSSADLATTTGVWDDNFVMVNHLAHDGVATTTDPDFPDSTKYNNDGSSKNMNSDDLVDGQIDGSLDFDGGNDYVGVSALNLNSNTVTISAWVKRNGTQNNWAGIVMCRAGTTVAGLHTLINGDLRYEWNELNWGWDSGLVLPDSEMVFVSLVVEPTKATIYLNNAFATNIAIHSTEEFNEVTNIGQDTLYGTRYFNGIIDEVRISNVARTAGWIETEYNNQVSVGSFMSFGEEVCLPKPVERSGGENVKTMIKGGTRIKGGVRF